MLATLLISLQASGANSRVRKGILEKMVKMGQMFHLILLHSSLSLVKLHQANPWVVVGIQILMYLLLQQAGIQQIKTWLVPSGCRGQYFRLLELFKGNGLRQLG